MRRVFAISLAILVVALATRGVVAQDAGQSVSDRLLEILKDRQVISPKEYGELKDLATRMEEENAELGRRLGDLDRSIADYLAKEGDEPTANLSYRQGKGFRFFSHDGLFELGIGGWLQFLYTYQEAERNGAWSRGMSGRMPPDSIPFKGSSSSDTNGGVDLLPPNQPPVWSGRRANDFDLNSRIWFWGTAFDKMLKFMVELDVAPMQESSDYDSSSYFPNGYYENFDTFAPYKGHGGVGLLDAYVDYDYCDYFNVRFGQFKPPTGRQFLVHQSDLAMPWRHIVAEAFELKRDVGAMIHDMRNVGDGDMVYEYMAGIFNGEGKDASWNDSNNLAYAGRLAFYPMGYIPYEEGNYGKDDPFKMGIAGWYAHHRSGQNAAMMNQWPGARVRSRLESWGVDLVAVCHGFFATGEYIDRQTDVRRKNVPTASGHKGVDDWGWFAQAGYKVTDDLEIMGRYGKGTFDKQWTALFPSTSFRLDKVVEYAFGATYYFAGHDMKMTVDLGRTKYYYRLAKDTYYQWIRLGFWLSW